MKKILILTPALAFFLLTSCGGGGSEVVGPTTVEEKLDKIAEHKAQIKELELSIRELEKEIMAQGGSLQLPADTIPVTTLTLSKTTYEEFVEVAGTVMSDMNILVSSEIGGTVTNIAVKEGQSVSAGQLLLNTDDQILQKSLDELQSAYDLAKTVYEKRKSLWDQNIGSEIEYLTAKNNMESLELRLKTTKSQWSKTQLRSPISGVVDDIITKTGEMASPGMPLLRVVNLNSVNIQCDVSEAYLGKIKKGDKVSVKFPSISYETTATVQNVGQVINSGNRTFKVDVQLPNGTGVLKPNLLGYVSIREFNAPDQVVVPTKLIQSGVHGKFVYTVVDGKIVAVDITAGRSYNGMTQVVSGLNGSEVLVDEGYRSVKAGDIARIVESATAQNNSNE